MDLLVSDCKAHYLINASPNGADHIRVGILLCANATSNVARFTLPDKRLDLLIPQEVLSPTQIIKTYNIDLPILRPINPPPCPANTQG